MPEQADEISALVNSAYRGESSRKGWTTEDQILGGQRVDPALVIEMIKTPGMQIELLFDQGVLVACMQLTFEYETSSLYVGMLTVNPELQARGYGKMLLERVETLAQKEGFSSLRMTVIHLRSELIAYYERRGYQKTGKVFPFPSVNPRLGLPKVADLSLVEMVKTLKNSRDI